MMEASCENAVWLEGLCGCGWVEDPEMGDGPGLSR